MSVKGPQSTTAELAEKFKFSQYSETAPLSPAPQVGGSGTLNPLRRWPFNMQEALCIDNGAGFLAPTQFDFGSVNASDASSVELFIFSEASPIVLTARHQIGPFFIGDTQTVMHFPTLGVDAPIYQVEVSGEYDPTPTVVVKGDGSPYTDADLIGPGAALHAATGGGLVRVKGFPFKVARPLPSAGGTWTYVSSTGPTVNTQITAFTYTSVRYHGLAASPNGFVPFAGAYDKDNVYQKASIPVILRGTDYTAAIRDNKNLIETPTQNFRVVGIYRAV